MREFLDFLENELCYGCGCCVAVCKKDALKMEIDQYGFFRPNLDQENVIAVASVSRFALVYALPILRMCNLINHLQFGPEIVHSVFLLLQVVQR